MSIFLIRVFVLLSLTAMTACSITNTTYYRSHDNLDVIIAGGKKKLGTFKFAKHLRHIQIHNNHGQTIAQFPDLEIIVKADEGFKLKLADLKLADLKRFEVNNGEGRYIPVGYPAHSKQYDFEGLSIILSADNKFLGARVLSSKDNEYFLGRGEKIKKIPITISDLKDLFGEGKVFNVFNH